jgi:putative colanic acid biosynthesis acetyltransferase WcaF
MKVDLSKFSNKEFNKGAGILKRTTWYFINVLFIRPSFIPLMKWKIFWLRFFGAKIGHSIYIKPGVNIKSPWFLEIGNNCWIGENVWIDNIDKVKIGNNVCISQGALLLTGNHNYTLSWMPYRNAPIIIEDGVWIGAKSIICPGVTASENSILTVGSIATHNLEKNFIYQGNPAIKIRERIITQ